MARTKKDKIKRKRFTTLLPEGTIAKIKHMAIDKQKSIYEIVENAVDEYIERELGKGK